MILKIHSRGAGGGEGPVGYLLGKNRDREQAVVLRGDPEQTVALIDSLEFARKYTSGVLSFEESDIPEHQKEKIMDSLEANLLAGLDADQYDILWVEHRDKDRLELNFVIPNLELTTGKRLQPYYDPVDRKRCSAWQDIINFHYNLSDPNDPEKRRLHTLQNNVPKDKAEAVAAITNGLASLIDAGEVKNRSDILASLEAAGIKVSRQTKHSISVLLPGDTRPTRLKGGIYEQDFRAGEGVRDQLEEAIETYRGHRKQRVQQAREVYKEARTRKLAYNGERYQPKRKEISEVFEREYSQLRAQHEQDSEQHHFDIFEWADGGSPNNSRRNDSNTEIELNQLTNGGLSHVGSEQTISVSAQENGGAVRGAAERISDAAKSLADTARRYAAAIGEYGAACINVLATRRRDNEPNGISFRIK